MLTGSDLIMAGFDVHGNAGENGIGEHLDNLISFVARRFKRKGKKAAAIIRKADCDGNKQSK